MLGLDFGATADFSDQYQEIPTFFLKSDATKIVIRRQYVFNFVHFNINIKLLTLNKKPADGLDLHFN